MPFRLQRTAVCPKPQQPTISRKLRPPVCRSRLHAFSICVHLRHISVNFSLALIFGRARCPFAPHPLQLHQYFHWMLDVRGWLLDAFPIPPSSIFHSRPHASAWFFYTTILKTNQDTEEPIRRNWNHREDSRTTHKPPRNNNFRKTSRAFWREFGSATVLVAVVGVSPTAPSPFRWLRRLGRFVSVK